MLEGLKNANRLNPGRDRRHLHVLAVRRDPCLGRPQHDGLDSKQTTGRKPAGNSGVLSQEGCLIKAHGNARLE
jgi:hypothetical protein